MFWAVLQKEFLLFRKTNSHFYSLLLYLLAVLLLCFSTFHKRLALEEATALFWIILLFMSLQASAGIFAHYKQYRLYEFTLFSPYWTILAKYLQQSFLLCFLFGLTSLMFWDFWQSFFLWDSFFWWLLLVLTALGFSAILTLLAALATRAAGAVGLLAILALPLLLPFLRLILGLSSKILQGFDWFFLQEEFIFLAALDAIALVLALLLFPLIWKD